MKTRTYRWAPPALRAALLGLVIAAVSGCAAGNKYSYSDSDLAIPISGSGAVGLSVVDRRPYVLNGDKPASFIGLQRGGFGNPFNVLTESGRPLAEDIRIALANGLRRRGYTVTELRVLSPSDEDIVNTVQAGNLPRNVVLVMREWKTDAALRFGLSHDLELRVLDANGEPLAEATSAGKDESLGSAGMQAANAQLAKRTMASKVEALFRNPEIRAALETR